ncbi:MAG: bifunctional methionine sulfoxide reductase B/A protein [Phycisphaerales bacterium]|nr:bifunctional methionine sulfoxide reductase B/A protein [Phycisphaerales bacterium]
MSPHHIKVVTSTLLACCMLAGACPSEHQTRAFKMNQQEQEDRSEPRLSDSGYELTPPSPEEKAKLVAKLTPEQKRITQAAGTEAAFCGTLLDNKKDGLYACVVCGLPLFKSEDKFTSGTGWPSFTFPFDREHVVGKRDDSLGMSRIEILCARCDAHLGHVFEDGPEPTGLRFCLNSESLTFHEEGSELPPESRPAESATAYFAGGCFWGIEYAFSKLPGVLSASSGYQNGDTESPDYKQVCTGTTGHAESVKVLFDPEVVDYETLVRFFFRIHDPTTLNRQGPDIGTQYRSGIYTTSKEQGELARKIVEELAADSEFKGRTIVTEIEAAEPFHGAEDYHQDYVVRTGRACHPGIGPAIEEFTERINLKNEAK